MKDQQDFNSLIALRYRKRINMQENRCKISGKFDMEQNILVPYRYVIGLGEKHFREFDKEVQKLTDTYPWTKNKHLRFIINELILNSQFSMLREAVKKIPLKKKIPAYFYLTMHISNSFVSAGIEEFGDFFDYYNYIDNYKYFIAEGITFEDYYDSKSEETVKSINDLSDDQLKLVLTPDHELIIADDSNKIGLNVIENATDNDFFITSFFKDGKYMWKRVHFRIENE